MWTIVLAIVIAAIVIALIPAILSLLGLAIIAVMDRPRPRKH
jgi:hypothetical protein